MLVLGTVEPQDMMGESPTRVRDAQPVFATSVDALPDPPPAELPLSMPSTPSPPPPLLPPVAVAQTEVRLPMSVIYKDFVVQSLQGVIPPKSCDLIDFDFTPDHRPRCGSGSNNHGQGIKGIFRKQTPPTSCQPVSIYNQFNSKGVCDSKGVWPEKPGLMRDSQIARP